MKLLKKILFLPSMVFVALLSCSSGNGSDDSNPGQTPLKIVINTEIVGTTTPMEMEADW